MKNGVAYYSEAFLGDRYKFTGIGKSLSIWSGEGDSSEKFTYRFDTTGYYYLGSEKNVNQSVAMIVQVVTGKSVESPIRVNIYGKAIVFSQPPIMKKGTVLVPLRPIFDSVTKKLDGNMHTDLEFTKSTNKVRVEYGDLYFILKTGSKKVETNSTTSGILTLAVAPEIINGTTYVPIRAFSNFYGLDVSWNNKTRIVDLKN